MVQRPAAAARRMFSGVGGMKRRVVFVQERMIKCFVNRDRSLLYGFR